MSYLLDTNICIRYLNGQSAQVKARLEQVQPGDVNLCSVVKAELLYGAAKSSVGQRTRSRLNRFFEVFESLPFDDRSAAVYGDPRRVGKARHSNWTKRFDDRSRSSRERFDFSQS